MACLGVALFPTAIGECGIAWSGRGVAGLLLPEGQAERTRSRLEQRFPGAPMVAEASELPGPVGAAVAAIQALLRGEPSDLGGIVLDDEGLPEFERRAWTVARQIPPGATLTYGEIARRLGEPGAARAVGRAMGRNPFPIVVPCHRVVAAGGRSGGFSAPGGVETKLRMLAIERARFGGVGSAADPGSQGELFAGPSTLPSTLPAGSRASAWNPVRPGPG